MKNRLSFLFALPFLPLLLAALALFGPLLFSGKALFWGTPMLQFVPWWSFAWETLLSGHLPLWNPLVGMGAPLLANYQAGLLYPPNWIYLILYALGGVPALAWGQALLVALHLLWAGTGMAWLARRLGLGGLAQAVAGLAFGLSGYLVARAGFLSINAAVAWLPWILLHLTPPRDETDRPLRRLLLLALCLALQLFAGHAQTAWYTVLLAGMWAGYIALLAYSRIGHETAGQTQVGAPARLRAAAGRLLRAWGLLALALALAVGLAAIQLLPTGEYLQQSQRAAAVEYEAAMTYSFWPWRLVTLLAPGFFGSPAQGDYWGYANYWEDAIYIGLLPFLLALAALLRRKPKPAAQGGDTASGNDIALGDDTASPLRWFLLALFALALLLALGQNTPVFPWLYRNVPTFSLFQAPARYMIWGVFALALLAALGVERWQRPEERGLYWTRLGTMGAAAVTIGSGLAWYFMGEVSPTFIRATAIAGGLGVVSGALSLLAPPRPGSQADTPQYPLRAWQWGVALFIAADLALAGWGLNPGVDLEIYRPEASLGPTPAVQQIGERLNGKRLYISATDEYAVKYERFLRFDTFDPGEDWENLRAALLPNVNLLNGLASANNFDPLVPGRYAAWMEFLDGLDAAARRPYLQMMGVGLMEQIDPTQPNGLRFDALEDSWRARWVPCDRIALNDVEAWEIIAGGRMDFSTHVLLPVVMEIANDEKENCLSDAPPRVIRSIEEHGPNRLTIQTTVEDSGYLVLSDVWYPGWSALVDGQPVEILRANTLFRAIFLPSGDHKVIFEYNSISIRRGALASLLSITLWAFLWRRWKAGS